MFSLRETSIHRWICLGLPLLLVSCLKVEPMSSEDLAGGEDGVTRDGVHETVESGDTKEPEDAVVFEDIHEVEILDTIEVAETDSSDLDIQEVDDVCIPDCDKKECGDDGCGGFCGECTGLQDQCVDGLCLCQPDCEGKDCGDDGCGGSCGECPDPLTCDDGQCTLCGNQTCDADETNANCPGDCPCPDNTWRHDDSGGGCYKLVAQSKVRAQALSHCEGLGGTLMKATPDNLDVMSLLYSDAGNEHFWIGLKWKQDCHSDCTKDNDEECRYGRWAWSLGACISYSGWASESAPWDSGEPNGDCSGAFCGCGITSNQWCSTSDECVEVINSAGKWNNLYCDNSLKFACEWMPE